MAFCKEKHVVRGIVFYKQAFLSLLNVAYIFFYGLDYIMAPDKALFFFFNQKLLIFFLKLHECIYCWHSLEAPHRGASNDYPQ